MDLIKNVNNVYFLYLKTSFIRKEFFNLHIECDFWYFPKISGKIKTNYNKTA